MLSIKSDWEYVPGNSTATYDDALRHKLKDILIMFFYPRKGISPQIYININNEYQKIIGNQGLLKDIKDDADTLKKILIGDIQQNILESQVKTILL